MNERIDNIIDKLARVGLIGINTILDGDIKYFNNQYFASRSEHVLLLRPLSPKAERRMHLPMYHRIYAGNELVAIAVLFPKPVSTDFSQEQPNIKCFNPFFRERLKDIEQGIKSGELAVMDNLMLSYKQFMRIKYIQAVRKNKKDSDFDETKKSSLIFKPFQYPQEKQNRIKHVSLGYNTVLILKNKSFKHYLHTGTAQLYTDSIIGYILEHSNLLNPDYFKYQNAPKEVEINTKSLLKLYPHGTFKLIPPEGVEITSSRTNAKRQGKNDITSFKFSETFLKKYRDIITKSTNDTDETQAFVKIPIFFILQALKNENLSSSGFPFLLYILSMYRMKNPRITHKLCNLITELCMDIKHGYKRPVERLNKYFQYLYEVNAISYPVIYIVDDLDSPPKFNGALLQIQKPMLPKSKKD